MYKYEKPFGDERIGASLKDLSIAIDKYSTNPLKDKIKFIDWILFNLIVGNVDAHAKNISFFIDNQTISITPFYDILNICIYDEFDKSLALAIGDNFSLNSLEYTDFIDLSYDLNIDFNYLLKRFQILLKKTKNNLSKLPYKDKIFFEKYSKNILERVEFFSYQII